MEALNHDVGTGLLGGCPDSLEPRRTISWGQSLDSNWVPRSVVTVVGVLKREIQVLRKVWRRRCGDFADRRSL